MLTPIARSGYFADRLVMVVFEFGGARRSGVLCRVPLYQAMYSTVARRALVLVGQGDRVELMGLVAAP